MRLPDGTPIRAVLLDLDDTLLDGRSGVGAAWDRMAAEIAGTHRDLSAAAVRAELERATQWFWSDPARQRAGRMDLTAARRRILSHVLEAFGRSDPGLVEHAAAIYTHMRDASLRMEEGALELVTELRERGACLALVTNGAAGSQRGKIARFGLARLFDHVQIEGEFGAGKPERAVFEHALRALGVAAGQALMAGNDFECDVLGALDAGLHAAWIQHQDASSAAAPRPFHRLRSLQELGTLLGLPRNARSGSTASAIDAAQAPNTTR